jgi:RNA polymerase sigma factor (sigma-70 family)
MPDALDHVMDFLRRTLGPADGDGDGELLRRFAAGREEAAFAGLVRRHGAMVFGVCRRLLHDLHDAEDAFQATFLLLARRAASVRQPESVASWLYGVAYRVARKARAAAARRPEVGANPAEPPSPADPVAEAAWHELRPVIDEELNRLPEKYRAPLVLCYLEGRTNEEAARLLGWTRGTVSGRLARARDLLRPRLARRGLALAAGGWASWLAEKGATPVSAALVEKVRAVLTGGVSVPAAALAQGVLRTMFAKKVLTVAAVVLALGLIGGGVGLLGRPGPAAAGGDNKEAPNAKPGVIFTLPEVPNKERGDDLQKMRGTWQAVMMEHDGERLPPESIKGFRVAVSGRTITFDPDGHRRAASILRLVRGVTNQPGTIWLRTEARKAPTVRGIYALADGRLTLCFDNDQGKTAPTNFTTTSGSGLTLLVLERAAAEFVKGRTTSAQKLYTFSFQNKPWKQVFEWLADHTGLACTATLAPPGTFTFTPPRGKRYTIPEIVDILNEALLANPPTQQFLLIRRSKTFTLLPADEKIDPSLVPDVSVEDLPRRGNTEIVKLSLRLRRGKAEDVAPIVKKLMSRYGEVVPVDAANRLILQDTAGSLRFVLKTLAAVEEKEATRRKR